MEACKSSPEHMWPEFAIFCPLTAPSHSRCSQFDSSQYEFSDYKTCPGSVLYSQSHLSIMQLKIYSLNFLQQLTATPLTTVTDLKSLYCYTFTPRVALSTYAYGAEGVSSRIFPATRKYHFSFIATLDTLQVCFVICNKSI